VDDESAPEVAVTPVGAPGTVAGAGGADGADGVAEGDGAEAAPVPMALVAVTVKV
jgi:hypothetical protein